MGDSAAERKAAWIAGRIEDGATDVLFFDDAGKNVKAVQALADEYPNATIRARKVDYAKDIDENVVDKN